MDSIRETTFKCVTSALTLEPIGFSSGVPNRYQVIGLRGELLAVR